MRTKTLMQAKGNFIVTEGIGLLFYAAAYTGDALTLTRAIILGFLILNAVVFATVIITWLLQRREDVLLYSTPNHLYSVYFTNDGYVVRFANHEAGLLETLYVFETFKNALSYLLDMNKISRDEMKYLLQKEKY